MSTRPPKLLALVGALVIGGLVGSGITFAALRSDRTPSDAAIGPRVAEILRGKDSLQRVTELSALLSTLGPTAATPVVEAFDAAPLDVADPELVVFAMWWARFDPQAALKWVTSQGRVRSGNVVAAVFRTWAHSDPQLAVGMASSLAFHLHHDLAVDAAIVGWDESGKPGLIESLAPLPDADLQRLADSFARRRVVALGPAGAFRWVESLEGMPRFQQIVAERVASAAAESAEGAPIAAAWATSRVRSDDRLSNFPRRIATRWVAHDAKAAMAWLAKLPAGADRDNGVTEAFRDWMAYDRPAATEWIESTGPNAWNEAALALYLRTMARESPKDAMERAQRIGNPELRESTMVLVARAWIRQDREAALAWIAQPGIPERVRRVSAAADARAHQRRMAGAPPGTAMTGARPTNTGPAPAMP